MRINGLKRSGIEKIFIVSAQNVDHNKCQKVLTSRPDERSTKSAAKCGRTRNNVPELRRHRLVHQ